MSKFYEVKVLKVEWYEYLDNGKTWGKTWTDGAIHLIDPKIWESRGRSIEQWIDTFHHEFWHYLTFVEEEEKADEFALKIKERAG